MPAPTTPPVVNDLPPAATRGSAADGDTFVAIADAFNAAQQPFGQELNALAAWERVTAANVFSDATSAASSAASAMAANGAANVWVSGTYAAGDVRWSPIDYKSYRCKNAGSRTIDPSLDPTNWALLAGQGDVTQAGSQSLSNKTIVNPLIDGTITEDVYTITDGAAVDINPANGSIQFWTLGANRTPTATSLANGQSVELLIADGAAYAVTWSTIGVVWADGLAPTLPTTGYARILLSKSGGVVRGAWIGNYAS